jgi:hypothetical protein
MIKRIKAKPLIDILGLDDRMSWGKYKGRSIEYIIYEEPSYIKWLLAEERIKLSSIAYEIYQKSVYARRYDNPSHHADYDNDFNPDSMAHFNLYGV